MNCAFKCMSRLSDFAVQTGRGGERADAERRNSLQENPSIIHRLLAVWRRFAVRLRAGDVMNL